MNREGRGATYPTHRGHTQQHRRHKTVTRQTQTAERARHKQEGRQENADIFAELYEALYAARSGGTQEKPLLIEDGRDAHELTVEEIKDN